MVVTIIHENSMDIRIRRVMELVVGKWHDESSTALGVGEQIGFRFLTVTYNIYRYIVKLL